MKSIKLLGGTAILGLLTIRDAAGHPPLPTGPVTFKLSALLARPSRAFTCGRIPFAVSQMVQVLYAISSFEFVTFVSKPFARGLHHTMAFTRCRH
jgi:hypothetical protein